MQKLNITSNSFAGEVCMNYLNETNVMFLSSLFIAISIEYSGLHNRIALNAIKAVRPIITLH